MLPKDLAGLSLKVCPELISLHSSHSTSLFKTFSLMIILIPLPLVIPNNGQCAPSQYLHNPFIHCNAIRFSKCNAFLVSWALQRILQCIGRLRDLVYLCKLVSNGSYKDYLNLVRLLFSTLTQVLTSLIDVHIL